MDTERIGQRRHRAVIVPVARVSFAVAVASLAFMLFAPGMLLGGGSTSPADPSGMGVAERGRGLEVHTFSFRVVAVLLASIAAALVIRLVLRAARRRIGRPRRLIAAALALTLVVLAFPATRAPVLATANRAAPIAGLLVGTDVDPLDALAPSIRVVDADGNWIGDLSHRRRRSIDAATLPPHVVHAVLAAEDERFFLHDGVDTESIGRAVTANLTRSAAEGGSTITQQLVKLNHLEGRPPVVRKAIEVLAAPALEREHDKWTLLDRYLEQIYLPGGNLGLGAAAEYWFGVTARELSPVQAATLAGMIRAPVELHPDHAPDDVVDRRDRVLGAMERNGWLDGSLGDLAGEPLGIVPPPERGPERAPLFLARVRREVRSMLEDPWTDPLTKAALATDGAVIHTTLDPTMQAAAVDALASRAPGDPVGLIAAVGRDGAVLSYAVASERPQMLDVIERMPRPPVGLLESFPLVEAQFSDPKFATPLEVVTRHAGGTAKAVTPFVVASVDVSGQQVPVSPHPVTDLGEVTGPAAATGISGADGWAVTGNRDYSVVSWFGVPECLASPYDDDRVRRAEQALEGFLAATSESVSDRPPPAVVAEPVVEPAAPWNPLPEPPIDQLRRSINAALKAVEGARISAVVEIDGIGRVFEYGADMPVRLASTNKIRTAVSALMALDPDQGLPTTVVATGDVVDGVLRGSLELRGSGDPTLTRTDLDRLAGDVRAAGITTVTGGVSTSGTIEADVADAPALPDHVVPGYLAPTTSLSVDHNRWRCDQDFLDDTDAAAVELFVEQLAAHGVTIRRDGSSGSSTTVELARVESSPVRSIVGDMLHKSDNQAAAQLFRVAAEARGLSPDRAGGSAAVVAAGRELGIDVRPPVEGVGLSDQSLGTASEMVDWLRAVEGTAIGAALEDSLPVGCGEGTLSGRFCGEGQGDRVVAKTGTLPETSALVGYTSTASGRRVRFAFFVDGVPSYFGSRAIDAAVGAVLSGAPPEFDHVATTEDEIFLTIDDGHFRDPRLIELASRVPLSAFVLGDVAADDPGFFRSLAAAGASVQNHTVTHSSMPGLPRGTQLAEICDAQAPLVASTGVAPTLFRAPFGAMDAATRWAVGECGLDAIVSWNATMEAGHLDPGGDLELDAGDIVLLHFDRHTYDDILLLEQLAAERGLRIGRLEDHVAGLTSLRPPAEISPAITTVQAFGEPSPESLATATVEQRSALDLAVETAQRVEDADAAVHRGGLVGWVADVAWGPEDHLARAEAALIDGDVALAQREADLASDLARRRDLVAVTRLAAVITLVASGLLLLSTSRRVSSRRRRSHRWAAPRLGGALR